MKLFVITGMSGSGKSKAVNFFEDNGYYCIDNLPAKLMSEFVRMLLHLEDFPKKVCVTMDVRDHDIGHDALRALGELKKLADVSILFLDCTKEVLLKRYKESRRLHPLMMADDKLTLATAIDEEYMLLSDIRQKSDFVIDTSQLSTAQFREKLVSVLPTGETAPMQIRFVAFGYKYGLSSDFDLVFDVRCLPNPFYVDELREMTGADRKVRDFVMSGDAAKQLFEKIKDYLEISIPLYEKEGKAQLVVGLGCTGGQHRSLTFAILLAEYFGNKGYSVNASSRDSVKNVSEIKARRE